MAFVLSIQSNDYIIGILNERMVSLCTKLTIQTRAGTSPLYLAGREIDENEVNGIFEALVNKVPVSSVIYSGLRGVGKTDTS